MNEFEKKIEKLKSLVALVDESVTKDDFLNAWKTVIDFVKEIEKKNRSEMESMHSKLLSFIGISKKDISSNFDSFKRKSNELLNGFLSELSKKSEIDYREKSDLLNKIIKETKYERQVDEKKITEEVIARMPKQKEPDGPEEIRNKLEDLDGEDRLDKSAIRG